MKRTRILLAHRDEDLARHLRIAVNQNSQLEWGGQVTSKAAALTACETHPPDILILGTALADASRQETIRSIGEMHGSIKVVGLSDSLDPQFIKSMLRSGARGYILADEPLPRLLALIPAVLLGKTILSAEIIPLLL